MAQDASLASPLMLRIPARNTSAHLAAFGAVTLLAGASAAPQEPRDLNTGSPVRPAPADAALVRTLQQVSPARIASDIRSLAAFGTRSTLSATETLPPGQGVLAAADWIEAEFRRIATGCQACLTVRRATWTEPAGERLPHPTPLTDVFAVLRGSDPEQVRRTYLVTGHYDSRASDPLDARSAAPGANDDASGVAVSLECARILSRLKLPATVVFAAVTGEEQGLYGSRNLAQIARSEGWELLGVLDDDIVGGDSTPGDRFQDKSAVRIFAEGIPATATPEQRARIEAAGYESDSPSRELARAVLDVAETYGEVGYAWRSERTRERQFRPVLELRRDRFLRGGDHLSFNHEGFAAVRFTEWRENFAHQHQNVRREDGVQYGDLPDYVDPDYVAHVAVLNAATLAVLALAPPPPANVRILTRALDNDSTLEWDDAHGAPAGTRYELLWRETAASSWQRALEIAPRTPERAGASAGSGGGHHSLTVPISKDNVIFGLRAADAAGHRSPAVVPVPAP